MNTSTRTRQLIPNLLTSTSMLLGISAIFIIIQVKSNTTILNINNFSLASWLIILASVLDGLDGKVARKVGGTSSFGEQYDSLADLTAFIISPAILLYVRFIGNVSSPSIVIPLFFILCGAYRLARFNATHDGKRKSKFSGLPTTVAGPMLAAFTMFAESCQHYEFCQLNAMQLTFIALIMAAVNSLLMISTIPYSTFPPIFFRICSMPLRILILFLVFAGIYKYAGFTLLVVAILYNLESIISWLRNKFRAEQKIDNIDNEIIHELPKYETDEIDEALPHTIFRQ